MRLVFPQLAIVWNHLACVIYMVVLLCHDVFMHDNKKVNENEILHGLCDEVCVPLSMLETVIVQFVVNIYVLFVRAFYVYFVGAISLQSFSISLFY